MSKTRGSEWRKWDLHVHTPKSIYHQYGPDNETTWENYIKDLESLDSNFSVLGINDYLFLDGYERLKFEKENNNRLQNIDCLLPVLEFRIEMFAGVKFENLKRINLHVIFSEELSVETIKSQFLNTLEQSYFIENGRQWTRAITRESVADLGKEIKARVPETKLSKYDSDLVEGFNNLNLQHERIFAALKKDCFVGKHLIAIGKTEWGDLKWSESSIATKKSIINSADIVFTAANSVEDFKKAKISLTDQGVKNLLLNCSDAHYLSTSTDKDRIGNCWTWIKANPTFEGLKQILYEPEHRLKIQNEQPDYKEDKLTIDQVRFIASDNKFTTEAILLNKNLNVIIGGKSSGKSILLYNIANTLLADKTFLKKRNIEDKYQFKTDDSTFNFEIKTKGGFPQLMYRDANENSIIPEIKYIPQNYLIDLAEPEENKTGSALNKIIRDLINEDVDSKNHYSDFITKVRLNDKEREGIIDSFFELKLKIEDLEGQLKLKSQRLILETNIASNTSKVEALNISSGMNPDQITKYNELQKQLEINKTKRFNINNDGKKITEFTAELSNLLGNLQNKEQLLINALEDEKLKIIVETYSIFEKAFSNLNLLKAMFETVEGDNGKRTFKNPTEVSEIFNTLTEEKRNIDKELLPYLENAELKKQIEIILKSISDDKDALQAIDHLSKEISDCYSALTKQKERLFNLYIENYQEYGNVIEHLKRRTINLEQDKLKINGLAKFNFAKFRALVFSFSDKRKSSFRGFNICDENKTSLDVYNLTDLLQGLKGMFDAVISGDYSLVARVDKKAAIKIILDDYFFDYWEIEYKNDKLGKMSTGKASFVILMLIVGLSRSKAPILIDQPEDNLDNRSITTDLVEYLRDKKLERQIILVTHNPNIVVNADAENIIVANQKGQNDTETSSPYLFDYINGGLEDSFTLIKDEKDLLKSMGVREHIAEIVEGGKEAFKKREEKYGFNI